VSVIHVHEADIYGNARFKGISVCDLELARASKRLIITCERLIHNDEIRRDPSATQIPYFLVDAVCEVPYGAYPGNMVDEYFSDEEQLKLWWKRRTGVFQTFMDKYIYGVKDFEGTWNSAAASNASINCAEEHMIDLRTKRSECHA
jgi:glutaconate CoA-transferase subunit A